VKEEGKERERRGNTGGIGVLRNRTAESAPAETQCFFFGFLVFVLCVESRSPSSTVSTFAEVRRNRLLAAYERL